jgi:predicted DCC family thiol-disulfide oxidoreductase YuxK
MRMEDHNPQVILVVYDGACAFCRRSIDAIRRRDRRHHFAYLARQTPGIEERYPQLAIGDFDQGMRVIEPDGTMHIGADAIYQIASRLPYFRHFSWLYHLPLARLVTRHLYAWVAANRMNLSRYCTDDLCELSSVRENKNTNDAMRPFYRHPSKMVISIFVLLVVGGHALPVLQELKGHRQTLWPIMAWGMYRYSHDGNRPIEVSIRRLIGTTARGEEFEITAEHSGLFHTGFVRLYLEPIIHGDASAVQSLAERVNVGRDDPVVALRLEGETHTLTSDGIVQKPIAVQHHQLHL